MSKKETDQEPTMEEILASIRRIISENDEAAPEAEAASEPEAAEPAEEAAPEPAEEEVLELTDVVDEKPEAAAEEKPEPEPAPAPVSGQLEAGIISAARAVASTSALGQLAQALDHEPQTTGNMGVTGRGNTLEDLVRDMLRPLLKDWLDDNLPELVDHLVKKEIQRMVNRAEDT